MATLPSNQRELYDVSTLPGFAFDQRAPVWWGNLLLIVIETTSTVLLLASYFYLRQNYDSWPPPRVDEAPALFHPVPDLTYSSINTGLLVLSCLLMGYVDRAARRDRERAVIVGLTVLTLIGVVAIALRVFEFPGLKFWWDANAYASVVWSLLGLHLIYLGAAVVEVAAIGVWTFLHGLDEKHAVDVTLAGGYWYWMAGIWVPIYLVVYWSPHVI